MKCDKHPAVQFDSWMCPVCEAFDAGVDRGKILASRPDVGNEIRTELEKLEHNLKSMLQFIGKLSRKC